MPVRHFSFSAIALGICWTSLATAGGDPPKTPHLPTPNDRAAFHNFDHPDRIQGSFIVKFKKEAQQMTREQADAVANALATKYHGTVDTVFMRRTGKGGVIGFTVYMSETDVRKLAEDPRIELVTANVMMKITGSEALPGDKSRWHLDRLDQNELPLDNTYHFDPSALGESIDVYIIDTGVRTTHHQFDHISPNVLNCGTACEHPEDSLHYPPDWIDDPDFMDCLGHGTAVASFIAGSSRGIAREANIIAIRSAHPTGSTCSSGVESTLALKAMNWINWTMSGSQSVVNLSLGYQMQPAYDYFTEIYEDLIEEAMNQGASVVVAAGNENDDACNYFPAVMASTSNVITVGATTKTDARRFDSNYGNCVTLFAPGDAQSGADRDSDSDYATWSQTSMATPLVTGIVAVYKDLHPGASPYQVKQAIVGTATANTLSNVGTNSPNLLANTWNLDSVDYDHTGSGSGQDGGNDVATGDRKGLAATLSPLVLLAI